jgi:hypothetical protein
VNDHAIDIIIDTMPIQDILLDLLQNEDFALVHGTMQIVGNILGGPERHLVNLLKQGLLDSLSVAWKNFEADPAFVKDLLWGISNIVASTNFDIIYGFLQNEKITNLFLRSMNNPNLIVLKQCMWVVGNLFCCTHYDLICFAINSKSYLAFIVHILKTGRYDNESVMLIFKGLDTVFSLERRNGSRDFYLLFEKLNGIDELEKLQTHPNLKIYDKATHLL